MASGSMDTSPVFLEDSVSLLQEELTCPVCQGIFRDPILLSCTHSFCRDCLVKSWQQNKRCPLCRKEGGDEPLIPNRALNSACESFLNELGWRGPHEILGEDHCPLHRLALNLFCLKDETPICVECVALHRGHGLLTIREGAPYCKAELEFKVEIFEAKVRSFLNTKKNFTNTVEFIKHQASQAEKMIKAEFERLHKVLVTEEVLRLRVLADEEQEKLDIMERMIENLSADISLLSQEIETFKKHMGDDHLPFLKRFRDLKRRAQWTADDPELHDDILLDMGKHAGSLGFKIWRKMQMNIKYNPVIFDPNTASPWLSLSHDLTSIKESQERQVVPANPERFDPCVFILGHEGYTTGRHKWDVIVGDNPKWILGVCTKSLIRKKKFTVSTKRGVWAISLSKGAYNVMTPERMELKPEKRPERIRIKLDMEKGEVSFWDGGTGKHLCSLTSLTNQFDDKIFPLFGPGLYSTPMSLAPGKTHVHTS